MFYQEISLISQYTIHKLKRLFTFLLTISRSNACAILRHDHAFHSPKTRARNSFFHRIGKIYVYFYFITYWYDLFVNLMSKSNTITTILFLNIAWNWNVIRFGNAGKRYIDNSFNWLTVKILLYVAANVPSRILFKIQLSSAIRKLNLSCKLIDICGCNTID